MLIVDGELPVPHALRRRLQRHFKPQRLAVELCVDPLHKLQHLHGMHFDVPIGDHRMPRLDGVALLAHAGELDTRARCA